MKNNREKIIKQIKKIAGLPLGKKNLYYLTKTDLLLILSILVHKQTNQDK